MKPFLLTDYFDQAAERWDDRVAMEDGNAAVTYRQLWETSRNWPDFYPVRKNRQRAPLGYIFPKGFHV